MQSELVGFRNAKSPRDIGSCNTPCGQDLTSHGNPEVISSPVGLVPTNALVFNDTVSHGRKVGYS